MTILATGELSVLTWSGPREQPMHRIENIDGEIREKIHHNLKHKNKCKSGGISVEAKQRNKPFKREGGKGNFGEIIQIEKFHRNA